MSVVIAVREGSLCGSFIGFELDHEILEYSECTAHASYRIRYTKEQKAQLPELRFKAHQIIVREHPRHSDDIRLA